MNPSRRARDLSVRTALTPGRTFLFAALVVAGTIGCRPPGEVIEGTGGSSSGSGGNGSGSGGSSSGSGGNGSGGHGSGGNGSGGSASGGNGSGGSASGGSASGGQTGGRPGSGGAGGGTSSGGRGGATGGSSSSGGSAAGGSAPMNSCTNDIMDGNETGVDCGGSCPTACVSYKANPPNSDGNVKNACEGGGTGFICPRFMMFSPEMKQAAADDAKDSNWPQGSFNYAVVTLNGAKCCECFQIVYSNPQNSAVSGVTPPKAVIGQNFNQGGANNAFDVFMGKGGLGAQQAGCPKMYSTYPNIGEPNTGGIKATNMSECKGAAISSQACVTAVTNQCTMIKSSTASVEKTTQNSCVEGNLAQSLYHENWNVKAQKIECPVHLTEVTGCRLNSQGLPKADPSIQTASQAGSWSSYGTTTMQDCCKPSCSWPNNVSGTMSPWSTMYQCSMNGAPMTK